MLSRDSRAAKSKRVGGRSSAKLRTDHRLTESAASLVQIDYDSGIGRK